MNQAEAIAAAQIGAEWVCCGVFYRGRWPDMQVWSRMEADEDKRWMESVGSHEKHMEKVPQ